MPVSRGRDCLQLLIPLCFTFSAAQKYRKSLEELKALAETKCLLNAEGKMYSPCMLSPPACEEVGAAVTSGNGILEKGPVFVPAFIGCWVRDHLWKLKILHLSFKSGWAAPFWGVGVGKRSIRGEKSDTGLGSANCSVNLKQNQGPFSHLWTQDNNTCHINSLWKPKWKPERECESVTASLEHDQITCCTLLFYLYLKYYFKFLFF